MLIDLVRLGGTEKNLLVLGQDVWTLLRLVRTT